MRGNYNSDFLSMITRAIGETTEQAVVNDVWNNIATPIYSVMVDELEFHVWWAMKRSDSFNYELWLRHD